MRKSVDRSGMVIVIDTREQKPYPFGDCLVCNKALATGDYSLVGFENSVAVERKTKPDIYQCIGKQRKRFIRELERMRALDYAAIVIEDSLRGFCIPPARSAVTAAAAVNSLVAWSIRYNVHVFWACDNVAGAKLTRRILEKFWSEQTWKKEREKELEAAAQLWNYVIDFGKFQALKLSQIDVKELDSYLGFLEGCRNKTDAQLEAIEKITEYLQQDHIAALLEKEI